MPFINKRDIGKEPGVAALFIAHANGYVTVRALEERRVRIMKYLAENKYRLTDEEAKPLYDELAEINNKLEFE